MIREALVEKDNPLRPGKAGLVIRLTFLVVLGAITLMPMIWMILSSLQPQALSVSFPPNINPLGFDLRYYQQFLGRTHVLRWTLNSLIFAGSSTLLTLVVASLAGYAFAKIKFPGSKYLFWLYIITLMLPFQVAMIPLYIIMTRIGLTDTYLGLILPAIASPLSIFLMKQVMQTIPTPLLESARLDGCNELQVWKHIIIPLSKPGIAFLGIITFVQQWNNFLWPLVITESTAMRPLQVGLTLIREEVPLSYSLHMAGATYAAIPMIIVFFVFQKHFLRGVTVGAMKG